MKTCQNNACGAQIPDQAAFCPKCGTPAPEANSNASSTVAPPTSVAGNSSSGVVSNAPTMAPPPLAGRPAVPPPPPLRVVPPAPQKPPEPQQTSPQTSATSSRADTSAQTKPVVTDQKKEEPKPEEKKKSNNGIWAVVVIVVVAGLSYLGTQSSSPPPVVTPPPVVNTPPKVTAPVVTPPPVVNTPPKVTAPVVTPPVNTNNSKPAAIVPDKTVSLTWMVSDQSAKACADQANKNGVKDWDPKIPACVFHDATSCDITTSAKESILNLGNLMGTCNFRDAKFLNQKGDVSPISTPTFKNKTMKLEFHYGADVLQTCNRIAEKRGTEKFTDPKIPSCYFAVPAQNFCAIGMKTPQPNGNSMYDLGAVVEACFKSK